MTNKRHGFTLLEIVVVIGIITLLIAFLLPTIERARHKGYIASCGSNLHQIGLAFLQYENENHGEFPRTRYDPAAALSKGTGINSADPFAPGGPSENDLTAPAYLLMRVAKLPPTILLCPYNDVFQYEPDKPDIQNRSNFSDYRKNLGYSFADPYPNLSAVQAEYRLSNHTSGKFALAADKNGGTFGRCNVLTPTYSSPPSIKVQANSPNHEQDGQNVLFADGHVDWCKDVFVGVDNDNIYTTKSGQIEASPMNKDDSVLLPAVQ